MMYQYTFSLGNRAQIGSNHQFRYRFYNSLDGIQVRNAQSTNILRFLPLQTDGLLQHTRSDSLNLFHRHITLGF